LESFTTGNMTDAHASIAQTKGLGYLTTKVKPLYEGIKLVKK